MKSYTKVRNDATSCALIETLEELQGLREEMLHQDECKAAGLLLAQIGLILERVDHGIPSTRETFCSILRAAELTEPTPEAEEVTV